MEESKEEEARGDEDNGAFLAVWIEPLGLLTLLGGMGAFWGGAVVASAGMGSLKRASKSSYRNSAA